MVQLGTSGSIAYNGIWLCEGKGLEAQNFNLSTND